MSSAQPSDLADREFDKTLKNGSGRSLERTGLRSVFPVNREKTGKIHNFWLNQGYFGDFCAISVCVNVELESTSLLI